MIGRMPYSLKIKNTQKDNVVKYRLITKEQVHETSVYRIKGTKTIKRGPKNKRLKIIDSNFAIVKFPPTETIPSWALNADVFSIARTDDELSIVCPCAG